MHKIIVVDYPVVAIGLSYVLGQQMDRQVIATSSDPCDLVQPHDLVLIELFLPEAQCGLRLARQLQHSQPNLIPIVWTSHDIPLYIWASLEYRGAGFLSKSMSISTLVKWLEHATLHSTAWPGNLMGLAREWSEEAARLRALSKDLWILWYLLLLGDSNAEIGAQLCWSQRTIERRLTQLYVLLGVQSRSEAVTLAWKWNLIHAYQSGLAWSSVILDMFPAEYAGLGTKEFGV